MASTVEFEIKDEDAEIEQRLAEVNVDE